MAWHPFRNLGLKAAALGLGTLLWFIVSGQQVERSIRAPLEFVHVPSALEITGDQLDSVFVHVRGTDTQISRLTAGDVRAVIDLTDARPMVKGTLTLRTDQIVAPFGVEVMQVDPPQVTLTLERSASAMVPVVPTIVGTPTPGFVMTGWTVDPPTVEVIGPESQLKQLGHATTAPISIDRAAAPMTQTVTIGVPDSTLRLREAKLAHVTIAIVKKDKE